LLNGCAENGHITSACVYGIFLVLNFSKEIAVTI